LRVDDCDGVIEVVVFMKDEPADFDGVAQGVDELDDFVIYSTTRGMVLLYCGWARFPTDTFKGVAEQPGVVPLGGGRGRGRAEARPHRGVK